MTKSQQAQLDEMVAALGSIAAAKDIDVSAEIMRSVKRILDIDTPNLDREIAHLSDNWGAIGY